MPWLSVRPFIQTFYYRKNLVCLASMNQINRSFTV